MVVRSTNLTNEVCYHGLRMTADEYLALPETDGRYELVDGVAILAPSPSFEYQDIVLEIACQLRVFLQSHPIGSVVTEVDVRLRDDLVYRPDVVYLSQSTRARIRGAVTEIPQLVVEVVSPGAAKRDLLEKRRDYEAAGVAEYWVIDPQTREMHFFGIENGRYVALPVAGDEFRSKAVPGFVLRLELVRALF